MVALNLFSSIFCAFNVHLVDSHSSCDKPFGITCHIICEKWYCIGICFPVMESVFFEPEGYKLTYVACQLVALAGGTKSFAKLYGIDRKVLNMCGAGRKYGK
jgi:hypothetical protein